MRSFFGNKFRAAVLTVVFSATLVPIASAAPKVRDREKAGLRDDIARVVRVIKNILSPSTNADSLTTPRP
jgi:hypothetical protein